MMMFMSWKVVATVALSAGLAIAAKPDLDDAPKAVSVRLSGVVRELDGKPVAGATVYALGTQILDEPRLTIETKAAATTTTARDGSYTFPDVKVPTSRMRKAPQAASPFVEFKVLATAPGFGIGWHKEKSMYATDPRDPDDIQGRLPLGSAVVMDVALRPEAELKGRVVDEDGKPVAGVKVRVADVNLLDERGMETTDGFNLSPESWPGELGRAVTGADGRFRLAGLPSESCSWLWFERPGSKASRTLYASNSAESETTHGRPEPHNGRSAHPVFPKDMTVSMPSTRKIEIRVVADDGKPVPDVRVNSMGETLATGATSGGKSDAEGRVTLELPAGQYRGLCADPVSVDSKFVRTYLRPFVVAAGPKVQPLEFRMKPGSEILLEVVDAETGKGVPGIRFQIKPDEPGRNWEPLRTSTFYVGVETTGPDGRLRALLEPVPGKTYQVRIAATQPGDRVRPYPPRGDGPTYEMVEKESDPFDLAGGASSRIRFTLKKK